VLVGPRAEADAVARAHTVIQSEQSGPQATLVVHANGHSVPVNWTAQDVLLEELVLAYLGQQRQDSPVLATQHGKEVQE
jgi:hypothetical protein